MVFKNGKTEPLTQTVPTTTKTTTTEENKEIVYITKTSNKYHAENCYYARNKGIPIDKETAENGGYKPCKLCIE